MTIPRPQQWTEAEVHQLRMLAKRKVSADCIAKSLGRYVGSVKTKARELNLILSRRLKKSEEMSAPGPPWTPEEDGCSDRWGRLAKAPPRLQRCSSAKRRACTSERTYSRSSWPVRRRGRSQSGNDQSRHQSAWRCEESREPRFMSTTGLNLI
jgi:hypothetical protein